jgi:tetratricopeptide (TPR) repeat protein/O-antigen ligase
MKAAILDKYCQAMIEGSLMLLIFLVPWWVDTRLSGIMLGKLFMMQIFTIICLIGLLIKAVFCKRLNFYKTSFDLPILTFLIVSILSTVFSVCPYISFWGAYYRYEGLVTFINYILLFYITANWLDKGAILRILSAAVFAGAVVSLYGLLQHLHIDLVGWREYGTNRVISTFGNSVYFGAYAVTVFPLALYGYMMKKETEGKAIPLKKGGRIGSGDKNRILNLLPKMLTFLSGIACLLILSGIFVSNTRGAFIGFVASCVIFGVLIRKRLDQSIKPRLILLIAGIICISLYFILNPEVSPLKRFMETVTKQTDEHSNKGTPKLVGGAASRVLMWRDALGIIKDYPLLGTGPETFGMIYSKYRSLDLIRNEGGEYGRPDRVHNDIIDLTVTKGLLGGGAYLWFLFMAARVCLRKLTRGKEYIFAIAIFSGGIGYFVQNQFCFWILPSTSLFFIMTGCIAGLAPSRQAYNVNVRIAAIPVIAILIIGLVFCVIKTTLPWYMADIKYKQGAELYWSGEKITSIDRFKSALSLNPMEKLYVEYIVHACLDTSDKLPKNIELSIFEAQRMSKIYPLESNFYNLLGMSYERKKRFEDARRSYEKMLTIDPLFGEARNKIANIYINQNKFNEAIAVLEEGLRIIPDHVPFLNGLAQIYMIQKMDNNAEKYLKDVARLNPDNLDSHTNLARIYYEQKRFDLVIAQCREMIRIEPNNVDTHRNLASLYYQQKRYQEALDEFQKVLELKPDDEYSQRVVERMR